MGAGHPTTAPGGSECGVGGKSEGSRADPQDRIYVMMLVSCKPLHLPIQSFSGAGASGVEPGYAGELTPLGTLLTRCGWE